METITDLQPKIDTLGSLLRLLSEQVSQRTRLYRTQAVTREMELWFPLLDITDAFANQPDLRVAAIQRRLDMRAVDASLASIRTHMTFFAAAAHSGAFNEQEYALYCRYSLRVLGAFNNALAHLRRNLPSRASPTVWDEFRRALAAFLGLIALIARAP